MKFISTWGDLIQLVVGVGVLGFIGIWDLKVDIQDRDQDKLIRKIETELMLKELERRGVKINETNNFIGR
jgi:hypothetical protein